MDKKDTIELARRIADAVGKSGGRTFYVGGFVRDRILGRENKDVDIEIHGISEKRLCELLGQFGETLTFGSSFAVYNIKGHDLDIALPRTERKMGEGHRAFDVTADPFLGPEKASSRRDFTINALMEDVITGEVLDFHGGLSDLRNGVIRHVSSTSFTEDPLRVYRAAQFAARFGFSIAPETAELCRQTGCASLPSERIFEETSKALLKSDRPSVYFRELRNMGHTEYFPELYSLIGVPQPGKYHAEGDAFEHTMLVLDRAAALRDRASQPREFMLAALCHDLGKITATKEENGELTSYGHAKEGLVFAEPLIKRLTSEKKVHSYVSNMVENHMEPHNRFRNGAKPKSTNKMFFASVCPEDLILLAEADSQGSLPDTGSEEERTFLEKRLAHYKEVIQRPYVMGEDLIRAGIVPDASFRGLMDLATKLRLSEVDRDTALKQVLAEAGRRGNTDGSR